MKPLYIGIAFLLLNTFGLSQNNLVTLGRASNIFTFINPAMNQVAANDELDAILFVHRQDVTIWGGGTTQNGKLRYDISVSGGQLFASDIGELNPTYQLMTRYPNISFYNPPGNTNLANARGIWAASTLNQSGSMFDGHSYGTSQLLLQGNPSTIERDTFQGSPDSLVSGLCQRVSGEYWTVNNVWRQSGPVDSIHVNKGVYNPTSKDIQWVRTDTVSMNSTTGMPYDINMHQPNMGWSPDGKTGWIAWIGDVVGDIDSVRSPCFVKSTDSGATWSNPIQADLSTIPWIYDSLRSLWTDQNGNPISTGKPTCGEHFDIVVDSAGAPHFFVTVGSASTTTKPAADTMHYEYWKGMIDVSTPDGGATWTARLIAPALTYRYFVPNPFGAPVEYFNYPQVSRTEDGSKIYYSWVDTDTNDPAIPFGHFNNTKPNLLISGSCVSTGYQACYKKITHGNILWDGRIHFQSMAPTVLDKQQFDFLPIVFPNMLQSDPSGPTDFKYVGNDCYYPNYEFFPPSHLDLSWKKNGGCYNYSLPVNRERDLDATLEVYPNPAVERIYVRAEWQKGAMIAVVDILGNRVAEYKTNDQSGLLEIDISHLSPGIYVLQFEAAQKLLRKKIIKAF